MRNQEIKAVNEWTLEITRDKKQCYPLTTVFFKTASLITLNKQMQIKNSSKTIEYFTNVQSTGYCLLYRYLKLSRYISLDLILSLREKSFLKAIECFR